MRIAYASDIHIEFADIKLTNDMEADVLVLAGDIFVSKDLMEYDDGYPGFRSERIHNFFISCSQQFKHIVYVAGNHESYHSDIHATIPNARNCLKYIKNLHILDKESVEIDGVIFLGATMWTDMNDRDPETVQHVRNGMNDFRIITNSKNVVSYKTPRVTNPDIMETKHRIAKWDTVDAIQEFEETVEYFNSQIKDDEQYVIVTHHCPSFESVAPEFANDSIMNGGYCSNLEKFIETRPSIRAWFHGHVHCVNSYTIGETLVRSNPRGYKGYEARADEFELQFIDI